MSNPTSIIVKDGNGASQTVSTLDAVLASTLAVTVTNLPATQPVTGSVAVSNLPATQAISGSVSVSNLPTTQPISAASLPLPTGAATAASQPALNADGGSLAHVTNFPATQAVSGSVAVSNLPATQPVSLAQTINTSTAVVTLPPLPAGTNAIGTVTVSNLPATQGISGKVGVQVGGADVATANPVPVTVVGGIVGSTVSVSNFPATQAVAGSVAVSNLPATQAISAASLPLPAGAAQDATLGTLGTTPPTLPGGSTGIIGILRYISTLFASLIATGSGNAYRVALVDPTTGNGSLVQAFHNSDNQAIGTTSYGLMTGGVDQLINASGNLDRKRAVAGDAMTATGLAAEVPMIFNGTTYDRLRSVSGDGAAATGIVQEALAIWNGTTYDRATGSALRGMDVSCKPTASPANALTPVSTTALASSLVLKATAGNLYGLQVTNGATAGYVMLFNATSAPADGAVTPVKVYAMAANTTLSASWGSGPPTAFSTGITVVYSSTGPFTKTASATAFISGEVM